MLSGKKGSGSHLISQRNWLKITGVSVQALPNVSHSLTLCYVLKNSSRCEELILCVEGMTPTRTKKDDSAGTCKRGNG